MEEEYEVPVLAMSCLDLGREDIVRVLTEVLYQFPVREIAVQMPRWILSLPADHWLRRSLFDSVTESAKDITHIRDAADCARRLGEAEYVTDAAVREVLPGEVLPASGSTLTKGSSIRCWGRPPAWRSKTRRS